jgi:hypothetical protein
MAKRTQTFYLEVIMNEQEINDIIKKKECTDCKQCEELGYCVYEEDEDE